MANIAGAVGLGAALDYLRKIDLKNIARYEQDLTAYGMRELGKIPGINLLGTAREKAGILAFTLADKSSEAIGRYLNKWGIAVRAGHHCAQPILRHFGLETVVRPSLAFYNTYEEIDFLVWAIRRFQQLG